MRKSLFYIIISSLTLLFCCSLNNKESHSFQDYIMKIHTLVVDTTIAISYEEFESEFDTIPIEFGYFIFDSIILKIDNDSSKFKGLWSWYIDTVDKVMICKTNNRLDPHKVLSNDTYFFLIDFWSEGLPFMASIYADLSQECMGTFGIQNFDTIKYVYHQNDRIKIDGLKNKLLKHSP